MSESCLSLSCFERGHEYDVRASVRRSVVVVVAVCTLGFGENVAVFVRSLARFVRVRLLSLLLSETNELSRSFARSGTFVQAIAGAPTTTKPRQADSRSVGELFSACCVPFRPFRPSRRRCTIHPPPRLRRRRCRRRRPLFLSLLPAVVGRHRLSRLRLE